MGFSPNWFLPNEHKIKRRTKRGSRFITSILCSIKIINKKKFWSEIGQITLKFKYFLANFTKYDEYCDDLTPCDALLTCDENRCKCRDGYYFRENNCCKSFFEIFQFYFILKLFFFLLVKYLGYGSFCQQYYQCDPDSNLICSNNICK